MLRPLVWLMLLGTAAGCGGGPVIQNVPPSRGNLRAISTAWARATDKMGRPPADLKELEPYLKEMGDPSELLRSPEDGQDYVIRWGADYRSRTGPGGAAPVIAYEKEGRGGRHLTLRGLQIIPLDDEELTKSLGTAP